MENMATNWDEKTQESENTETFEIFHKYDYKIKDFSESNNSNDDKYIVSRGSGNTLKSPPPLHAGMSQKSFTTSNITIAQHIKISPLCWVIQDVYSNINKQKIYFY